MTKAALSHPPTMRRYLRALRQGFTDWHATQEASRPTFAKRLTPGAVAYWRKRDPDFDAACFYYGLRRSGLCLASGAYDRLDLTALAAWFAEIEHKPDPRFAAMAAAQRRDRRRAA